MRLVSSPPQNKMFRRDILTTPWAFLLTGIVIGSSSRHNNNNNNMSLTIIQEILVMTESFLVPFYTLAVVLYLTAVAFRKELRPVWERLLSLFSRRAKVKPQKALVPLEEERKEEELFEDEEPQPINLSGAYKLVSNDNFEAFLEVQGVPWALRRAANQARPTHRITHRGRRLTIKIEGIIESQTTYMINGPPVETNVRGRIFEDNVSYLESGLGIIVKKKALTEDYDVTVQRELSQDKQSITMTSTAFFRDGKVPVKCVQLFRRSE